MRIYNTLTREKEELIPQEEGHFKIYACGPTVYNYIHIGNARPICVFEVLRRYLEYRGNKVTLYRTLRILMIKSSKKPMKRVRIILLFPKNTLRNIGKTLMDSM